MEKIEVQTDNNCLAGSGGKEGTQGTLGAGRKKWQCRLPRGGDAGAALQDGATGPHYNQEKQASWCPS